MVNQQFMTVLNLIKSGFSTHELSKSDLVTISEVIDNLLSTGQKIESNDKIDFGEPVPPSPDDFLTLESYIHENSGKGLIRVNNLRGLSRSLIYTIKSNNLTECYIPTQIRQFRRSYLDSRFEFIKDFLNSKSRYM